MNELETQRLPLADGLGHQGEPPPNHPQSAGTKSGEWRIWGEGRVVLIDVYCFN